MAKYGLALDNLLSADVVTAEGRVLQVSGSENPDLFWAVRGGGGNFGVVASLEFKLHPVGPMVSGGLVAHAFDKANEVLRYYRSLTASLPEELVAFGGLVHAPDGSGTQLAAIVAGHCGDAASGEAALKPIKEFGQPVVDAMGPLPYNALNSMLDAGFPKGALNYWKSSFLSELSDQASGPLLLNT
jgi:FAD/FMN-containing dehydrogenase